MKCIVTGGAGFIGSHLADRLISLKHDVIVIDDLSTGNKKNISTNKKIIFQNTSILDLKNLQKIFKGSDYVFHLAAIPSVGRSLKDPKTTNEANITGTLNVLLAARDNKVKKVIYAASSSAYGDTKILPKVETMMSSPKSPYALTKFVGEKYCEMFSKYYGLPTVSLRYFNVFGPRQSAASEYAAVIPKFIISVLQNKKPVIFGDGKQTRDFTFVMDTVNANILAMKSKTGNGEVINIACNKNISLLQLLKIINKILGKNITPQFAPGRLGDVHDSLADIRKAKKLLGYKPQYSLEEGMQQTIAWIRTLE